MDSNNEQLHYMRLGVNAFLEQYRELLSSFDWPQVAEALGAYCTLGNGELPEKISIPVYRKYTEEAFLTLYDRGAISLVAPITALGENDLARMRRSTGIGAETLPPPPPKAPTADELLEQEVRNDYANLPGDRMREKRRNSRAYETMFQKIADTLDSRVTANVRAGA
jgi:hypothetical protein